MIITPASSFNRPNDTTPYSIGDLVANSVTAGSVIPLTFKTSRAGSGRGSIRRVRLFKANATVATITFAIHFFTVAPVLTNGDNGAFAVNTSRNYLGNIAVDMNTGSMVGTADAEKAGAAVNDINFDLSTIKQIERRIYGYLVATSAYTPVANELFEAIAEIYSDS